jgi:hypothetical protein
MTKDMDVTRISTNTATKPPIALVEQQPPRLPTIQAGGKIQAIIPTTFEDAWRIANVAVKSGFAPKDIVTAEAAMVCIMHGMEVGLPPMAALQSIAVINGRPTIWGDAAIGLVKNSGLCEYISEWEEPRDGNPTAICETKRKGEDKSVSRTFSLHDQTTAGLVGKDIHKKYPVRMRQMRARAFCLRDTYADVLKGLPIREEVMDYDNAIGGGVTIPPLPPLPQSPTNVAVAADTVVWDDPAPNEQNAPAPPPIPPIPTPTKEVMPGEPSTSQYDTQPRKEVMPTEPRIQSVDTPPRRDEPPTQPVKPGEADYPDIPPGIDRRQKPEEPKPGGGGDPADADQWLRDLAGALGGCEDLASFGDVQQKIMAPMYGKVSPETWKAAMALLMENMGRIQRSLSES